MAASRDIRAGKAFVELYAQNNLSKGFRAAEAAIKEFGSRVTGIGAAVGAAGAAVLGPMLLATKGFADRGDDFEKMSRRTGVATEELSKLSHAAQLSGTSIDSVENSVRRLQKNMEDARQGTGEAKKAFEQLGISAEALSKMTATEALAEVAGKLKGVENANVRAAMAMQIFGKSGTDLLPMLEGGKDGLTAMFKEAERLGLVIDTKTAKSAANLKDELYRMTAVVKNVAFVVGGSLSEEIQKASKTITEAAVRFAVFIRENKSLVIATAKLAAVVAAGGAAMVAFGQTINLITSTVKGLILAKQALAKTLAVVNGLLGPKGWLALDGGIAAAGAAVMLLDKQFSDLNTAQIDSTQKVTALAEISDGAKAATIQLQQLNAEAQGFVQKDFTKTPLHSLGVEADELDLDKFERVKLQMQKDGTWNAQAEELFELYKKVILEKEDMLSLEEKAGRIVEQQKTAQMRYAEEVDTLNRLLEKKLLTQQQYNTELSRQQKILDDATKDPKITEQQRLAKQVYDSTRTPEENYWQEIQKLKELYQSGYIDADTMRRAAAKAFEAVKPAEIQQTIERKMKLDTAGEFSGFARFGAMGEATAAERTASAVEEVARNTRTLAREAQEGEIVV